MAISFNQLRRDGLTLFGKWPYKEDGMRHDWDGTYEVECVWRDMEGSLLKLFFFSNKQTNSKLFLYEYYFFDMNVSKL